MEITEFLLARIAEDEANARDAENYCPDDGPFVRWDSDRVLAECQAKRQLILLFANGMRTAKPDATGHTMTIDENRQTATVDGEEMSWADYWDRYTEPSQEPLKLLALPYADHPDYQPKWDAVQTPA